MSTKQRNLPIAEPYQKKKRTDQQAMREKRWPGMRFATASLYPVDSSQIPQYEMSMTLNPDLAVLIKGDEDGAREFIGPTLVLMGEPMECWVEKQTEWVELDQAEKQGASTPVPNMTVVREDGEIPEDTDAYAAQMGQRRDQID